MRNATRVSSCSKAGAYSPHWSSVKPFANKELRQREETASAMAAAWRRA